MSKYLLKNGSGSLCCRGCGRQDNKLNTYDWLADIPGNSDEQEMVEVQFKNTRKGYYRNSNRLHLEKGDIVAVEASPGHDIGTVTLTGRLVALRMRKGGQKLDAEIRRVYRKAKPVDLEKYEEAKKREHDTMIRSRKIAEDLGLQMKIGDVEYQGDGNKAIFYYIADERVDFRQLIKVLAEAFRVRIEMKQIGARQEAGRIGGIGPCGRELCCATWMTSFVSVSTSAARFQDISLNPQKLAGQCAKLKCCLNYEVDAYVECQKRLPSREIILETSDAQFYYFKADILKGMITYSTDKNFLANETTISARRAFEIIAMNRRGEKPDKLEESADEAARRKQGSDLLEQESLTRFDRSKSSKKRKKKGKNGGISPAEDVAGRNPRQTMPVNDPSAPVAAEPQEQAAGDSSASAKAVASQPRASRNGEGKPRREKGNRPRPAKVREEEGAAQQSKGENTSVNGAQPEAASRPPRQPRGPRRNGQGNRPSGEPRRQSNEVNPGKPVPEQPSPEVRRDHETSRNLPDVQA